MAELLKMGHGGTVYTMGASFFFFFYFASPLMYTLKSV